MTQKYYVMTSTGRRMSLRFPPRDRLPKYSLALELSSNNHYIAELVVLHGLIRGTRRVRKEILRKVRKLSTWPIFRVYLTAHLLDDLRKDSGIKITDEYLFRKIETYGPAVHHEFSQPIMIRSDLSMVAQAIYMRPQLRHIRIAITIVQRVAEHEVARGYDYLTQQGPYLRKYKRKIGWLPKQYDPRKDKK